MQVQPIPVKLSNGAIQNELTLIEFQGSFEHSEYADGQYRGLDLGQLEEKSAGNYSLTVGNQLLNGKMQTLQRPMVVAEKTVGPDGSTSMEIKQVIRKKILFCTRPTPLRTQQRKQVGGATLTTLNNDLYATGGKKRKVV